MQHPQIQTFTRSLLAILLLAAAAVAEDATGKTAKVGDFVPSYASTKCGGVDDGVPAGKTVCYTCRAGSEPIFYVFTRQQDDAVVQLLKEIDALVVAGKARKTAAVVNFLGDPADEAARQKVAEFGNRHALQHVALTITADGSKFGLNELDHATVILFEDGIIRMRTAAASGTLNDVSIGKIVQQARAVLK